MNFHTIDLKEWLVTHRCLMKLKYDFENENEKELRTGSWKERRSREKKRKQRQASKKLTKKDGEKETATS